MKYEVINDCLCQGYLYEVSKYYRSGLKKRELKKGEIVYRVKEWQNFYGSYIQVKKNGEDYLYDIEPKNLKRLKQE